MRAAALARLAATLSDRDRQVLQLVAAHRYLSTVQIRQFVFTTHSSTESAARTARAATKRLAGTGLLRPLDRRVGGMRPGSDATLWQLAPAGAKLLRAERSHYRTHAPSPRFLQHCLAVADAHLALRSMKADDVDVLVETEPDCWRRYSGAGGESRWLQPDLFASRQTADFEDRWFIEVDLGTESIPTLLGKCRQYEAYRASGLEQERHGAFPLVLWVFTKPERIEQLRGAIFRSAVTNGLFRFTTPSGLIPVLEGSS